MAKKKPTPTPLPTKKSGVVVALPNGSTVGLKDLGKVQPTPKPAKTRVGTIKTWTSSEYDALLRKIVAGNK